MIMRTPTAMRMVLSMRIQKVLAMITRMITGMTIMTTPIMPT